jgi:hypothetical protein
MKSHYATISTEQPREGQPVTSGNITDEMINEYINEQEGETVEDDSRFQIDPLEPLALQARVVQFEEPRLSKRL